MKKVNKNNLKLFMILGISTLLVGLGIFIVNKFIVNIFTLIKKGELQYGSRKQDFNGKWETGK